MHPATGSARLYLRLVSYAYPHRLIFLWSLLGMVALGTTEWILPAFLRYLVDHEFGSDRGLQFLVIPLVMMTWSTSSGTLRNTRR